jgi:hypothetical protein
MLFFVTAQREADRMMSSRCADPHQGSSCVPALTKEAEYMAATVFPSLAQSLPSIYDSKRDRVGKSAIAFTTNFQLRTLAGVEESQKK